MPRDLRDRLLVTDCKKRRGQRVMVRCKAGHPKDHRPRRWNEMASLQRDMKVLSFSLVARMAPTPSLQFIPCTIYAALADVNTPGECASPGGWPAQTYGSGFSYSQPSEAAACCNASATLTLSRIRLAYAVCYDTVIRVCTQCCRVLRNSVGLSLVWELEGGILGLFGSGRAAGVIQVRGIGTLIA